MARVVKEGMVSEDGEILTFEALNLNVDPKLIEEVGDWWAKELKMKGILREEVSIVAVESSADMLALGLAGALRKEGV